MKKKTRVQVNPKQQQLSAFMGWLTILVGTWMVASTLRQMVMNYFIGNNGPLIAYLIGFMAVGVSVALFGSNKPWDGDDDAKIKRQVELTSSREMSQFLGWIAMLLGTWIIASTTIDVITTYFNGNDSQLLAIGLGFIFIASAVVIFGKKKPWE